MAASDARPIPRKNVAYRLPVVIRKSDGTLITIWTGQDSEVSKDGGNFTDCSSEATEVESSGCGYLDLTADEMNADFVFVKITVTNTGALPFVVVLFPEELGDMRTEKTGYKLASDGLDSISTTGPTGVAANFRERFNQLWNRFFGKATMSANTLTVYNDAGTSAATTQTLSDDGTTQTQGKAASA